ncbi:MAG: tRNA epoxyqueuosine(34) reductase QueG [Pseudomonadota bacterium]
MITSAALVAAALAEGFDLAGVCSPAVEAVDRMAWQRFVALGYDVGMPFLRQTHQARERGAAGLIARARSVLVVARSYRRPELDRAGLAVARYALGKDYHLVLRRDLARMMFRVRDQAPGLDYRLCVDTSPLLERALARQAGLGWIGHNGMLISRPLGSYTLLGAVILDLDLEPLPALDEASAPGCGRCTACMTACPTGAIVAPAVVDPRRCISYWTIEHRGRFSADTPDLDGWVFGCDRCQEICPVSGGDRLGRDPRLEPRAGLRALDAQAILELDDKNLRARIAGSPVTRAGLAGLRRNARWIAKRR